MYYDRHTTFDSLCYRSRYHDPAHLQIQGARLPFYGVILMVKAGHIKEFQALTEETLRVTGPILFVTAAGGALLSAIL